MNYYFVDGTLYHINFKGNVGNEINSIHLGVLFNYPGIDGLVLCIPLTSPKEKHFKTKEDFEKRNYLNTKHYGWQYLKQTDSIALLEQAKSISKLRIKNYYENQDGKIIILDEKHKKLLNEKLNNYLKIVMNKK
ncbi:MAG: hypothetical protein E7162_07240 [Firmicutes bacterium]|nr:hypothetical protein [Bacillota bacterium]